MHQLSLFFFLQVPALDIEMIIDTSHLLVGINSAANFFLYYLLRKNFRSATWRLLTCKGGGDPESRKTTMMTTYTSVRRTHSSNTAMKTFDNGAINNRNGYVKFINSYTTRSTKVELSYRDFVILVCPASGCDTILNFPLKCLLLYKKKNEGILG